MLIFFILYLTVISSGILSSIIYLVQLRRSTAKLPEAWRNSASQKNFRNSIYLLTVFLVLTLINQLVLNYLIRNHINNGLSFSICFTVVPIPLFAFSYMHTQSRWKRYSYIVLHATLIGYLIIGGYYHPLRSPDMTISLVLNSVFFLIALIHLTDLLIHPETDHFKFKLKISLIVLVFALMASILSSIYWEDVASGHPLHFPFGLVLQNGNMLLFYSSFAVLFTQEILKLLRR